MPDMWTPTAIYVPKSDNGLTECFIAVLEGFRNVASHCEPLFRIGNDVFILNHMVWWLAAVEAMNELSGPTNGKKVWESTHCNAERRIRWLLWFSQALSCSAVGLQSWMDAVHAHFHFIRAKGLCHVGKVLGNGTKILVRNFHVPIFGVKRSKESGEHDTVKLTFKLDCTARAWGRPKRGSGELYMDKEAAGWPDGTRGHNRVRQDSECDGHLILWAHQICRAVVSVPWSYDTSEYCWVLSAHKRRVSTTILGKAHWAQHVWGVGYFFLGLGSKTHQTGFICYRRSCPTRTKKRGRFVGCSW